MDTQTSTRVLFIALMVVANVPARTGDKAFHFHVCYVLVYKLRQALLASLKPSLSGHEEELTLTWKNARSQLSAVETIVADPNLVDELLREQTACARSLLQFDALLILERIWRV
jgi:hypothetical protein